MSRPESIIDGFELFKDEPIVLNERCGTTLPLFSWSNGGPCSVKPFVWLSKPVGASDALAVLAAP
jgi:hypothetical protein